MHSTTRKIASIIAALAVVSASAFSSSRTLVTGEDPMDDPYLWLEEVKGDNALQWVREQNALTTAALEAVPQFRGIHERLLEIYNSADQIPLVTIGGDNWLYNFWQDSDHAKGIWRRTAMEDYVTESSPNWETLLDVDELSETEGENWVWKGAGCLPPDHRLCLVELSRGGGDASVLREFDTDAGNFVVEEGGGFVVPEAKSSVYWKDENSIWIGTDFGEGSMTTSGYPRIVKEWKRGTSLEDAVTIFEGEAGDVSVAAYSIVTPENRYDLVNRGISFYTGIFYYNNGEELVQVEIPEDATLEGFFKGHMLVHLRSEWRVGENSFPSDALLAINFDSFLQGDRSFEMLFVPSERVAFGGIANTADYVIYSTLDNINGKLYRATPGSDGWALEEIALPGLGTVRITSASDNINDFFFTYTDFVTPTSLFLAENNAEPKQVKATPQWYDASGVTVAQHYATSKDGTQIPYYIVMPADFEPNGDIVNPTLLHGYGGFKVSMLPQYSGTFGSSWIQRGGVYVLANIRGGGEFGPKWHEAAIREKHQTNFDDFIAVAEDLIARNITSSDRLGIIGGSQGGLLVGGSFVQRPDLFGAAVCRVPLLDMKRYNKLLAGASWMDEYGDPDSEDWDNYMKYWSPYQNLDPEKDYPFVLFTTSTNDDRVHPGHARKMAAKMLDMNKTAFYYENVEGGHGGAADNNQQAYMQALSFSHLWKTLNASEALPESTAPTTGSTSVSDTSTGAEARIMQIWVTAIVGAMLCIVW